MNMNLNGLTYEKIEADPLDQKLYLASKNKFTTQRDINRQAVADSLWFAPDSMSLDRMIQSYGRGLRFHLGDNFPTITTKILKAPITFADVTNLTDCIQPRMTCKRNDDGSMSYDIEAYSIVDKSSGYQDFEIPAPSPSVSMAFNDAMKHIKLMEDGIITRQFTWVRSVWMPMNMLAK
jgi:hypothetical protein